MKTETIGQPMTEGQFRGGDVRPIPDPTALTTAQLIREIGALKEVIFTRLDGMDRAMVVFSDHITRVPTDTDKQISHLKELHEAKILKICMDVETCTLPIVARLDGMDKAIHLVQSEHDIFPNRIDEKISAVAAVQQERFRSIGVQFAERDTRIENTSRDSKLAIDAALQAAKEAVAQQNISSALAITKSETATIKQIDQQGLLIQTATRALDDKIDDLKERITSMEARSAGRDQQRTTGQSAGSYVMAIIGTVLAATGFVIGMLLKH